jgi:hypothetical protein
VTKGTRQAGDEALSSGGATAWPYSTPPRQYDSASGVPIVMLPDPDTSYDTGPIIATIWQQFEEALTRARMVLVLGHSLHDRALVAALRTQVEPPSRLAVTVLPTESVDWRLSVPKQVSRPGRREHLLVAKSATALPSNSRAKSGLCGGRRPA